MKVSHHIFLLLLILWQSASAAGFRSFDARHGLSDNSILDIARDSTGYLWIASQSGLDRFDGYRFKNIPDPGAGFKSPPNKLAVDCRNNIYVMTADSLYTYCAGRLVSPSENPALPRLSWKNAFRVAPTPDGGLWILKPDSLFYFDYARSSLSGSGLQFKPKDIAAFQDGIVLLSPDGNLYLRNKTDRKLHRITPDATAHAKIAVIGQQCWLYDGLRPGIGRISLQPTGTAIIHTDLCRNVIVKDITLDNNGNLLLGTNNDGIHIVSPSDSLIETIRHTDSPWALPSNHISSLFIDSELLVAGTSKRGLGIAPHSAPDFRICHTGIESDICFLLRQPDGSIAVGYDGAGLGIYPEVGSSTPLRLFTNGDSALPSDLVVGASRGTGKQIFGTYGGGLFTLSDGITPISGPDSLRFCRHIISMPDYTYAGTFQNGLFSLSGNHFDSESSELQSNCITGLAINADRIIVATSAGISILDPLNGSLVRCPSEKLASTPVTTVFSDSRNLLWTGTRNGIIVTDSAFNPVAELTIHNGLTSDHIKAITEDPTGKIWVTTANGLSYITFTPDRNPAFRIRSFTENDGLGDISFNPYSLTCTPEGLILAGGFGKYLIVDSDRLPDYHPRSHVVITDIYINSRLLNPDSKDRVISLKEDSDEVKELEIDYYNSLSLSLSTLSPAEATNTRFEFRFDNEDGWTLSPSEILTLGELPPGRHTLQLRVAGQEEITRIGILVRPPFYRSSAAFFIYAVVLVMAGIYTYRRIKKGHAKDLGEQRIENAIARLENTPVSPDDKFITDAKTIIEQHLDQEDFSVEKLSEQMAMSRSSLYKKMTAVTGQTPLEFIRTIRLREGRRLLDTGESSISQIAYRIGMSPKQFSKYFKDETGLTPSQYLKRGE